MDKYLDSLGHGIKSIYHFLSDYLTHISDDWKEDQQLKQYQRNIVYWNNLSFILQEELFVVLKNSPYPFLNNLYCSDNINNCGWWFKGNDLFYYYDIYSEPQNSFVLEQIRQKLNHKIAHYQQQFIYQYGHDQAAQMNPCIYYGFYITSIRQHGAMIRFEITTHLSYR